MDAYVCVRDHTHSSLTLTVTVVTVVLIDRHSSWLQHAHFKLLMEPEFDLFWTFVRNLLRI